jgi:hypothetical protein
MLTMNKALLTLGLLPVLLARAAVVMQPTQVSLVWYYPTNALSVDLNFTFVTNASLALPVQQWFYFTNVAATNWLDANLNATNLDSTGTNATFKLPITVLPGKMFYAGVATNLWGISDFCPAAGTPPIPTSNSNLRITKP